MNDYARRMMRDGRNPYGSRGGYVSSHRSRRDRGEYEDGHYPRSQMRGTFEYERPYYDDYGDDMNDYRGGRDYGDDYGYDDYGDDMRDYGGRSRNARGQYTSRRGGRRDYGEEEEMHLTKRDVRDWEEDTINNDGSKGFKFPKEHAEQVARQIGFDPKMLGDDYSFWVAMNLEYADGCLTAKQFGVDRPEYYATRAKEVLTQDKDYEGKGAEKLYLYYKCIASKED